MIPGLTTAWPGRGSWKPQSAGCEIPSGKSAIVNFGDIVNERLERLTHVSEMFVTSLVSWSRFTEESVQNGIVASEDRVKLSLAGTDAIPRIAATGH